MLLSLLKKLQKLKKLLLKLEKKQKKLTRKRWKKRLNFPRKKSHGFRTVGFFIGKGRRENGAGEILQSTFSCRSL